jgi:hypothetical protein
MALTAPPPAKTANVAPPQPVQKQEAKQAPKKAAEAEKPPPPPPAPSVNTSGQVTGTTISTSA